MLKTAEVQIPQIADVGSFNNRDVLYEAFRKMVDPITIKDYRRWTRENSKRWIGGVTAIGGMRTLADIPMSVILRESNGMVQLIATNQNAGELDASSDYKKGGWEFSEGHASVLINAKAYLRGPYKDKVVVRYNPQNKAPLKYGESSLDRVAEEQGLASLARRIIFEELLGVILQFDPKNYPLAQVLTSPVWRGYNFAADGAYMSREAPLENGDLPKGTIKIKPWRI